MESIKKYVSESYSELVNKVTWPNWANLQSSTIVVVVSSIIFALLVFVMDVISKSALNLIYGI
ncbi:MAG: preprotein translocase subunit SecE [Saprospiraceae bacterium]